MNKITAKAILGELLEAYEQCEHGDYFYDNGDSVCNAVECVLREQPCWISVEESLPDEWVSVLGYMTDAGEFPAVRECYRIYKDFYFPALREFHPVSHWRPMPTKEEV